MSQAFAQLVAFNEREFQRLPAKKQPVFVYEWLKNFEDSLNVVKRVGLLLVKLALNAI
jgi:predicted N-acyltransferase